MYTKTDKFGHYNQVNILLMIIDDKYKHYSHILTCLVQKNYLAYIK